MPAIKKIICAVDLSQHSGIVADYAKTLAQGLGSEIYVIHAAPSLAQYVGFHVPPSSIESFVGEIVAGAEKSLDTFVAENFPNMKVTTKVLNGYAAEEILAYGESISADLIIMGTHGRTGIDRILFGSVAERVVKSSSIPVLTIRPKA